MQYNKIQGSKVSVTCLPHLFSFGMRAKSFISGTGFVYPKRRILNVIYENKYRANEFSQFRNLQ